MELQDIDFKEIIDKARDIILTHANGIVTYANGEAIEMSGYSRDEMIGSPAWKFIAPEYMASIQEGMKRKTGEGDDNATYELEIITKQGNRIPVEGKSTPLHPGKQDGEFIVVAREISGRKKLLEKQRRMENNLRIQLDLAMKLNETSGIDQILRSCLESAIHAASMDSGGIYMVRESGDLDLAVHQGLSDEFVEKTARVPAGSPLARMVLAGKALYTTDHDAPAVFDEVTRREGILSGASLPVKNREGIIAQINIASHERVEIPEETKDTLELIASTMGSAVYRGQIENFKQRLLSNTTHELKTPLFSICGAAGFLREINVDKNPASIRMIEFINRGARRLQDLVNSIIDYSRMEADHFTLEKGRFDLVTIVTNVVEDMQYMTLQKNQHVLVDLPRKMESIIDGFRMEQVFINLLSNAIKNTPEGGHVTIRGLDGPDGIRIAVQDDGIGITPEEMPRLFTKFGKIERKDANVDLQGTGLGLFISKGIVELHGGRIWAESAGRGAGSTFTIQLPKMDDRS